MKLNTTISLEGYSQENNGYISESGERYCDKFHDSGRRFCHTSLHKMRRTKAIATIVLSSRGIAVTPVAVSSTGTQVEKSLALFGRIKQNA